MTCQKNITLENIKSILNYNPDTGYFYWLERTPQMFLEKKQTKEHICKKWNNRYSGLKAGHLSKDGYTYIRCFDVVISAHIIAWFFMTGKWPSQNIDHIDGNKSNNAIKNLRLATSSENLANSKKPKHNSSGFKGVNFHKTKNKFRATINTNKKHVHLGYFNTAKEAYEAYCNAAKYYFGDFARVE